jgi:hypothetical protein
VSLTSNFFQRYSRPLSPIPTDSGIMAPKETKRDRERRLLKAQEQEATDAATDDGPTDDDVASPEVPIEYDAMGVVRPGTSSAAAAASTASGACAAAAVAKVGSLSMLSDSESDGVAREKERSAIPAKRASSRSSRSKVPKKKAKKSKKAHRRRKESSTPLPTVTAGVGAAGDVPPPLRRCLPALGRATATGRPSTQTTRS